MKSYIRSRPMKLLDENTKVRIKLGATGTAQEHAGKIAYVLAGPGQNGWVTLSLTPINQDPLAFFGAHIDHLEIFPSN